jgi:hypothetical protein
MYLKRLGVFVLSKALSALKDSGIKAHEMTPGVSEQF